MNIFSKTSRRELLSGAAVAGLASLLPRANGEEQADSGKVYRLGVVSARIEGKPQPTNGHCWQFTHMFCPQIDMDAIERLLDRGRVEIFTKHFRNPKENFNLIPFPDIRVTHYYEADPKIAELYTQAFPGVQVATSLEEMVKEVDAIWMGDASGKGEDHFDLVAPGIERGLPTFCDKPIGGTVAGTRRIIELARKHKAPLMSSSLFRHQWGTEEALRMRDSKDFGTLQYVIASQGGAYSRDRWFVYGQHPTWTVMTLCGAGVDAVSMYARENACHALITYKDRMPGEVWYGRPDVASTYCSTSVHFQKKAYEYTPAIEGNYWYGHHYQIFNMANAFRQMVKTGRQPVPHQEILEVTAIIHAAAKSLDEKSRLVPLAELLG